MLSISSRIDQSRTYCNGMHRRDCLKIGSLGIGGLSLPGLLKAEAESGQGRRHKSLIMVYLCGGPPHQDMF